MTFQVVLGDYTDDKAEAMLEKFLAALDQGIEVDGNFVPLAAESVEWSTEEDHPLKAEVAVTVNITFRGGVYRDIDLHRARDYRLEDIGKNNGKEPANGN